MKQKNEAEEEEGPAAELENTPFLLPPPPEFANFCELKIIFARSLAFLSSQVLRCRD